MRVPAVEAVASSWLLPSVVPGATAAGVDQVIMGVVLVVGVESPPAHPESAANRLTINNERAFTLTPMQGAGPCIASRFAIAPPATELRETWGSEPRW